MATSNQKRLWMNRSNQSERPETGGISGKPPVKIVDPGGSWRRFCCVTFTMEPLIAIFPFIAHGDSALGFSGELSQSLTKFPAFLEERK